VDAAMDISRKLAVNPELERLLRAVSWLKFNLQGVHERSRHPAPPCATLRSASASVRKTL
jgi:hypothetical protein